MDLIDDLEQERRPDTVETSPGVYVRTGKRQPKELDMLWSGNRPYPKEDRSQLLSFIGGFVLGAIITAAVMMLVVNKPQISGNVDKLMEPVEESTQLVPQTGSTQSAGVSVPQETGSETTPQAVPTEPQPTVTQQQTVTTPSAPAPQGGQPTIQQPTPSTRATARSSAPSAPTPKAMGQTYTVQNGDSLERIAKKFYGNGSPAMIEKIQRANNMSNPNALQLDQKLVIPPASY